MIVLLFISFAVNCHAETISDVSEKQMNLDEALKIYSTPFIDNYRARYAHNIYTQTTAVMTAENACSGFYKQVTFKIPCSKQDIENIKQLAKYGDEASIELAYFFIKDKKVFENYYKRAADNGSGRYIASYGELIMQKDPVQGKSYLDKAKASGEVEGYAAILRYYSANKMVNEFCSTMDEGYKKFNVDFITPILLHSNPDTTLKRKRELTLFDQYPKICLNKTPEELLTDISTDTSKLYQGYQYINDKQYYKAKKIFQELYDKSNDINIKQNAGFCLGAMYYYGAAVKKNTNYGIKLMEDAVNAGYEMFYYIPEISIIPNDKRILQYRGTCEYLLINETYERSIK